MSVCLWGRGCGRARRAQVRTGSDRAEDVLLSFRWDGFLLVKRVRAGAEPLPAGQECFLPWPVGADLEDALAGVAGEVGWDVPDPVAERVRVGFPQVRVVVAARRRVQAARSARCFAAMTQPLLTCQVLGGEVAQAHGLGCADAAGLDDCVLAVDGVDVLGVVASPDAGDAGVWDVRAVMEYFQPVFFSYVGQASHVPAGRLHAAGDPAQSFGPVPGAGHQAGDLRDVLVVLGGAVLGGAGLPCCGGDLPDGVLVGGHDGPSAGEQQFLLRGGQGQQVPDEVVAGAGPVDADEDPAAGPGRDLPDRGGQHLLVVGEGVRAGVAWPEQQWPGTRGYWRTRRPGMEAVALFPGGGCPSL